MPILPKDTKEFSDPAYWKEFFAKRKSPFEWYGDWEQVGEVIERYLRPADRILQIGCGNSTLADKLWDCGFRQVTSIDTDAGVIRDQSARNAKHRPELQFLVADATKMPFESSSYNVLLDKGTLDALYPTTSNVDSESHKSQMSTVFGMFAEVDRILATSGRYIIVSLAQAPLLNAFLETFAEKTLLPASSAPVPSTLHQGLE